MRLLFGLEYFGDCGRALDFYESAFDNASVKRRTFREMDMAGAFGISGTGLDMIWQSELDIRYADSALCMEMADSLLTAMQNSADCGHFFYRPVICIQHDDEDYARSLFEKIYGDSVSLDSLQDGNVADSHGMQWRYRKGDGHTISYCLEFDGFCRDVIAFYESVFGIKAADIITYGDSPHSGTVSDAGTDMIYNAVLEFKHHDHIYALRLCDSIESARKGENGYDPNALLFYQRVYNPIFSLREADEAALSEIFNRLTDGGKLNRPLALDDKGIYYGSLIDKYGICWNLYSA